MLFLSQPLPFCELDPLDPLADLAIFKLLAPFPLPVFETSSTGRGGRDLLTSGGSLRLMLKKPSYDESEATEDALLDFPREGVLSFQAATILRTECKGERGDVGVRGSCLLDDTAVEYAERVSVRAGESNDDNVNTDFIGETERESSVGKVVERGTVLYEVEDSDWVLLYDDEDWKEGEEVVTGDLNVRLWDEGVSEIDLSLSSKNAIRSTARPERGGGRGGRSGEAVRLRPCRA